MTLAVCLMKQFDSIFKVRFITEILCVSFLLTLLMKTELLN
jgi:hypothetical protein